MLYVFAAAKPSAWRWCGNETTNYTDELIIRNERQSVQQDKGTDTDNTHIDE